MSEGISESERKTDDVTAENTRWICLKVRQGKGESARGKLGQPGAIRYGYRPRRRQSSETLSYVKRDRRERKGGTGEGKAVSNENREREREK